MMIDLGGKSEMERRTVVAGGGGDSSTSSAESSFRELDEVFLQNQTKIWLGEVLNTRLDEDLHISDLLQDGELLFEVSKVVWDLLLTKSAELRQLKHKYGPFGSRKCSRRYRPYSNVDSFLKLCKILGLSGIDLFSPSDVVEKRDIRKVCICIRALSMKARSKQLRVPDFDMVMYSVSMPTDMVGCIRRSLESSQCTLSSSSSHSQKGSRTNPKQKNGYGVSDKDDDSCSDASDEAESRYMGEKSDLDFSEERYPIFGQYKERQNVLESDPKCQIREEIKHVQRLFPENHENTGENNFISDYLAFSDIMVHSTDDSNSVIQNGEKNLFDFFLNFESQRKYSDDDEDMEVSSTTSMTSVLGRVLNLEFDEQLDGDDSSGPMERVADNENHYISCVSSSNFPPKSLDHKLCGSGSNDLENAFYSDESVSESCSRPSGKVMERAFEGDYGIRDGYISCTVANGGQDKQEPNLDIPAEIIPDEKKIITHGRKPLLKKVVKGAAIAGVLFLFLRFGRKDRGENAQENNQLPKQRESKLSQTKHNTVSRKAGIYPSGKLKL